MSKATLKRRRKIQSSHFTRQHQPRRNFAHDPLKTISESGKFTPAKYPNNPSIKCAQTSRGRGPASNIAIKAALPRGLKAQSWWPVLMVINGSDDQPHL